MWLWDSIRAGAIQDPTLYPVVSSKQWDGVVADSDEKGDETKRPSVFKSISFGARSKDGLGKRTLSDGGDGGGGDGSVSGSGGENEVVGFYDSRAQPPQVDKRQRYSRRENEQPQRREGLPDRAEELLDHRMEQTPAVAENATILDAVTQTHSVSPQEVDSSAKQGTKRKKEKGDSLFRSNRRSKRASLISEDVKRFSGPTSQEATSCDESQDSFPVQYETTTPAVLRALKDEDGVVEVSKKATKRHVVVDKADDPRVSPTKKSKAESGQALGKTRYFRGG